MPNRVWQIEEQVFTVPEINYTFQFTSVHSQNMEAGDPPPDHDDLVVMKMWDPTGTKCLTMHFDRNGYHVSTELDDGATPPILAGQGDQPSGGPAVGVDQDQPNQYSVPLTNG